MANAVTHETVTRTAIADAVVGATGRLGTGGKIIIYSGTMPASASAALSGNVAIATITGVAFGAAVAGVSTVTASIADSSAVGGTASFFRLTRTDGTVILQGTCGTSASDLNLNSLVIAAGANVSLTGMNTYTSPV